MSPPSKTLVVRFSSIGDIVLSSPMLRALRAKFVDGQIDYVTRREYAELVKFNHHLNHTYEFDTATGFEGLRKLKRTIKSEGYDLIVDIHDSLRSKYLRGLRGTKQIAVVKKRVIERSLLVQAKKNIYREAVSVVDRYVEPLKRFGIENDGKGLELHIPDEVLFRISGKIATLRLERFERIIGICPGARHFTKRWPPQRFAELAARLANEMKAKVLVFGGEGDSGICSSIAARITELAGIERATDYCGRLGLLETAAAMEYCDAILTNDTGLMHMATAMRRKIVAIFGSTVKEFGFFPYQAEGFVLERDGLYCRPCSHIGRSACPEGHFRCMEEISVDEVFQKAKMLISGDAVRAPVVS